MTTTTSDVIDLLVKVEDNKSGNPEGITVHSLQYGMLRESPQIWSKEFLDF